MAMGGRAVAALSLLPRDIARLQKCFVLQVNTGSRKILHSVAESCESARPSGVDVRDKSVLLWKYLEYCGITENIYIHINICLFQDRRIGEF